MSLENGHGRPSAPTVRSDALTGSLAVDLDGSDGLVLGDIEDQWHQDATHAGSRPSAINSVDVAASAAGDKISIDQVTIGGDDGDRDGERLVHGPVARPG